MVHQHTPDPALSRLVDLRDLTFAGSHTEIVADAAALIRLARWANVVAVSTFEARVTLKRLSETRFSFAAEISADVEQTCVIMLEPVISHLALRVNRELHYDAAKSENHGELTLVAGEEDAPDVIDSLRFDVAAPLLEEFLLNIDPYPKKPGAVFSAPADGEPPPGPFAALEEWKKNRQP
jgi:hypothetical protein